MPLYAMPTMVPDGEPGVVVSPVCSVSVPEPLIVLTPVKESPPTEPACVPLTVHVDVPDLEIAFVTLGSRLSC